MTSMASIVSVDHEVSLEEQAQGLDWAHWLLGTVRQRCSDGLVLPPPALKESAHGDWRRFVEDIFLPTVAPLLMQAWQAALSRGASTALPEATTGRCLRGGQLLLDRTEGARYQAALGLLRQAIHEGRAESHLLVIWPCLALLFQLTPAVLLAEYLRLEWETATRDLLGLAMPVGSVSFTGAVGRALVSHQAEPRSIVRKPRSLI
jgi:hypothetical protein